MDQINMDVNQSRKILFEEENVEDDFSQNTEEEMSESNRGKTEKYLTREMSFQPSAMYNDDEENFEGADDEEDFEFEPMKKASKKFKNRDGDGADDNETESESDDEEEENDNFQVEGSYDPREFDHLNVDSDVSNLFLYIQKYQSQSIILDYKLKAFIPDFIPAVGDIDAFLKVTPPVTIEDQLGLAVLDEPMASQSDPSVLDLQLRAVTKQIGGKVARSKKVAGGDLELTHKELEKWIRDISDLHRSKPPPSVNYRHAMPDCDKLMQEWPKEVEAVLANFPPTLPDTSQVELETVVDIICGLLDIPIYKSRIEALHVLFSLFVNCNSSSHLHALGGKQASRGFLEPIEDY